jgi:hypothetical protein
MIPINAPINKNGIDFSVQVSENVSPALATVEATFPIAMRESLREMGQTIQKAVADEFETRRQTYRNTPTTIEYKKGKRHALVETGALKEAVTSKDPQKVKVEEYGNEYKLTVEWEIPTAGGTGFLPAFRKDNQFPYLWAQEFGTLPIPQILARNNKGFKLIKARPPGWELNPAPFFMDGVQKGIDAGTSEASVKIARAMDVSGVSDRTPYVTYRYPKPVGMGGILPSLFPTSLAGLLWYVVPPSQYYAVLGAASDIMGALRGGFFSFGIAGAYARQMAWGRVGMTKKIFRRKIRGRIWYGD